MKSFRGSKKELFAIPSWVLLGFIQLGASDECGVLTGSAFKTSNNSSSPFLATMII